MMGKTLRAGQVGESNGELDLVALQIQDAALIVPVPRGPGTADHGEPSLLKGVGQLIHPIPTSHAEGHMGVPGLGGAVPPALRDVGTGHQLQSGPAVKGE